MEYFRNCTTPQRGFLIKIDKKMLPKFLLVCVEIDVFMLSLFPISDKVNV